MHLDRRLPLDPLRTSRQLEVELQQPGQLGNPDREEGLRRLAEQWRWDADVPRPNLENGVDEDDRMLLDDYQPRYVSSTSPYTCAYTSIRYLQHAMRFLQEQDAQYLSTDSRLFLPDGHGNINVAFPFRPSPVQVRAADPGLARQQQFAAPQPVPASQLPIGSPRAPSVPNSNAVAIHSMKKQPAPSPGLQTANQPVRLSAPLPASSPFRPSAGSPVHVNGVQSNGVPAALPVTPTPMPVPVPATNLPANGQNGNVHKGSVSGQTNGVVVSTGSTPQVHSNGAADILAPPISSTTILQAQHKAANQLHVTQQPTGMPNGYANGLTNNSFSFPASLPSGYPNQNSNQHHALSLQQTQQLKMAFAGLPPVTLQNSAARQAYLQQLAASGNSAAMQSLAMLNGVNVSLKMPQQRQIQWAMAQRAQAQAQAQAQTMANVDGVQMHSPSPSHASLHSSPPNGHLSPSSRPLQLSPSGQMLGPNAVSPIPNHMIANAMSSHMVNGSQSHISPTRGMPTPNPSPSLQQQQLVGGINPGVGY